MTSKAEHLAVVLACGVVILVLVQIAAREAPPAGASAAESPRVLTYFISEGDPDSGFHASDIELARWAFEAWERNAAGTIRLQPAAEDDALLRLYWQPADGTYGEMRPLRVGDRIGAALFVHPDIDELEPAVAQRATTDPLLRDTVVYLTCVHEIGHALGLAHTRDERDIMYFFGYGGDIMEFFSRYRRQLTIRDDIKGAAGLSDADIRRLQAQFTSP